MQVTSPLWPLRDALLPIVGRAGCRRLLSAMYDPALLRAVHAPEALRRALDTFCRTHDIEAVPRREQVLDSDSKSHIYVVHTELAGQAPWPVTASISIRCGLKWPWTICFFHPAHKSPDCRKTNCRAP